MMPMRLTRVQHTCVRVDGPHGSLVIDPSLDYHGRMWSPRGRPVEASSLLRGVDAILITHAHSDHFHPPTLLHFGKDIPIVVPAADSTGAFPMLDELASFGFRNLTPLSHGDSIELSGLTVYGFDVPESIETLAQMAYLIMGQGQRILHTADALEGFLSKELLAVAEGCDVALLPMNASLNVANLRNQMSPATFALATSQLKARVVVPLGTNEGVRRPATPLSAPWFPFGDAHLDSPGFNRLLPADSVRRMHDGDSLNLDGPVIRTTPGPRVESDDPNAAVDKVTGEIWSLLVDVHRRSRSSFGLDAELSFDQWRDRWCAAVQVMTGSLVSGENLIDECVAQVPLTHAISPALTAFPRSLRAAEVEHPGTHARSLWSLEPAIDKNAFTQAVYSLLSQEASSDGQRWLVLLEFVDFLQRQHYPTRPPEPSPWSAEARSGWWRRQVRSDLESADFVYPLFNPIFGPFHRDQEIYFLATSYDGRRQLRQYSVPGEHHGWIGAITRARGQSTLADLISSSDLDPEGYLAFADWVGAVEPYILDTHWMAGHSWAWTPAFDPALEAR